MTTATLDPFTTTSVLPTPTSAPPAPSDVRDWKHYQANGRRCAIHVRLPDRDIHRCVGYAALSDSPGLVEIRVLTGPDKGRYRVLGWEDAEARLEQLTRRAQ